MADPDILIAIQSFSTPGLDSFFTWVTHLGHEYAYILILLIVFWCVDRRIAHRVALLFLFSMWLNGLLKEVFATPRPSADQGVRVLVREHSFSFPSGHAQGAMTLWGALAWSFGSRILWIIAVALILLVGFSRIYLGAHYPVDVVGGYGIGAALLVLWGWAGGTGAISSLPRSVRLILAVVLPVGLLPLYQSKGSIQLLGFLLGLAASNVFALDLIPYDPRGGVFRQSAKLLIGLSGLVGLYILHRRLPGGAPEALGYAVMAVWITVIAPWLFVRLGLARAVEPAPRRRGHRARSWGSVGWSGIHWSRSPRYYPTGRMARPLKSVIGAAVALSVVLAAVAITYEPSTSPAAPVLAAFPAGRTVVIGHRGAAGLAPENTLLAVRQGLMAGSDWIEIDVQLSADGYLVLMHDESVDRTTDGSGLVRELPLAQIQALDAGFRFSPDGGQSFPLRGAGVRVPTLDEVFRTFPDTRFVIEIKGSDPRAADAVAQAIETSGAAGRVLVGAFDPGVIERFRERMPSVPTTAHRREALGFVILARVGLASFVKPRWDVLAIPSKSLAWLPVINQGVVDAAAQHERPVFAFTVNDGDEARRLLHLGVGGIVTDRPDVIAPLVH